MINSVGNSHANTYILHDKKESKSAQSEQTCSTNSAAYYDTVEISHKSKTSTESEVNIYSAEIKKMQQSNNQRLRSLVEDLIRNQGACCNYSDITINNVDQMKQAISQDGEFGVKAVSDQIVKFAIAISGDDKTKLDTLKAAIEKGFEQAGKAFGGKLPDICNQTHDEVMKRLDEWAKTDEQ